MILGGMIEPRVEEAAVMTADNRGLYPSLIMAGINIPPTPAVIGHR